MQIIEGDCKEEMQKLIDDGVQVDSIVTDPPYELGFMGKAWDKTGIAYDVEMWRLCFELLKPGGHLLSFGGSRTYHRMACAIEDAGFEIRDQIMWITGQGFPKSLDISKQIDKMAGAEREVIGINPRHGGGNSQIMKGDYNPPITSPATDDAKKWQGFGTALKPAHEPIVLARKPISESTIAENVLTHGTGGLNIDGCRILVDQNDPNLRPNHANYNWANHKRNFMTGLKKVTSQDEGSHNSLGRFPANLIHDGSDEVMQEFAKYGETNSYRPKTSKGNYNSINYDEKGNYKTRMIYGRGIGATGTQIIYPDRGSVARYFYCAKASKKDRNGSKHPTVKPIELMKYLCRLITPKGGVVLDPFAGTGSTGFAAKEEGFESIMIEREPEYIKDIYARFNVKREKKYTDRDLFEEVQQQTNW